SLAEPCTVRNVLLEPKLIEQAVLHHQPLAHHAESSAAPPQGNGITLASGMRAVFQHWVMGRLLFRESDTIGSQCDEESSHGILCRTGCLDERDAHLRCRSRRRRCAGDKYVDTS